MALFDTLININEDVHGERLRKGLQETNRLIMTMSEQQKFNVLLELTKIHSELILNLNNMTPEGQIKMGRMIQEKARKMYDFQVDLSCGTWMAGAWLESLGRISKTKNDKAQEVFLFLNSFCEDLPNLINDDIYWLNSGNGYELYEYGKSITETKSAWRENDLLVYHFPSSRYFLLEDYKFRSDNELRPIKLIKTDNQTLWCKIGSGYFLYDAGDAIAHETQNARRDNDLLIYHSISHRYYLLEDYANRADNQLRPAKLIKTDNQTLWCKIGSGYFLYDAGNVINRVTHKWRGNDLLIYHSISGSGSLRRASQIVLMQEEANNDFMH